MALRKQKLTKEQLDLVQESLKKGIRIEEIEECHHEKLTKISKNSMWFQCNNCEQIFYVFGAVLYNKQILKKELKDILKHAR